MGTVTGYIVASSGLEASRWGAIGAMAYTGWFVGFLVVAVVVYRLRTNYGYTSIFEAVHDRYGVYACVLYALIFAYRIHQLVWQNIAAGAAMFGAAGAYSQTEASVVTTGVSLADVSSQRNTDYWIAVGLLAGIPLVAAMTGGRRWSMLVAAALSFVLVVVLALQDVELCNRSEASCVDYMSLSIKTPDSQLYGMDLLILTGIQGLFAYPWHDPVIMDHAFLASPLKMAWAFCSAFVAAIVVIAAHSTAGLHAFLQVVQSTGSVWSGILPTYYSLFAFDNLTYAMIGYGQLILCVTALTATLVSAGQFVAFDLAGIFGDKHKPVSPFSKAAVDPARVKYARFAMVFFTVVGVGVFAIGDDWLVDVSNVALTPIMSLGLGMPIVFMELVSGVRPFAFIAPVLVAAIVGILHAFDSEMIYNNELLFGDGAYKYDLAIGVLAAGASIPFFALGWLYRVGDSTNRGDSPTSTKKASNDAAPVAAAEYEYYDDEEEYEYYE
ncbi:uncharacterized protein AMSG_05438 [Thecamonas trahens ATCC 50062]|uniref:Urea transporter n=1 Tax=Thecamonas trahens ATCC 50062 TaxID=461836 RepID=A0A0L0DAR6_THETB|nr:hypothetical protein AMSG_05438 [Thecamonas trahens ATCC 50062]KNC49432.1 hypothetical protein AMSG_05438 [Thecamonas trahens ATCC 50062]|eukprot:XP_013757854.1 hypothetical protein AMSG_05438 [Thecamonas trahens ATCC 50062]